MNCRTFREQLADLVAGELDSSQRAAAHEHMRTCAQCRELARGLEAAAAVVEADVVSPEEAERQTAGLALPKPHGVRPAVVRRRYPRLPTILRYAAVILLAFAGGYSARGWRASEIASPPPPDDRASPVGRELAQRYAMAMEQFPNSSALSRSLLALARR
jgi:anti-sigma factor RsiW